MKKKLSSGAKWEDVVGYSRGVRVGNQIEISGTTSMRDGKVIGRNDIYLQTKTILEIISDSINELGGNISDVVRTRMYVTDITKWEEVAKAHQEVFHSIKPSTSMVEVSNLIDDDLLIEIEATAIVEEATNIPFH